MPTIGKKYADAVRASHKKAQLDMLRNETQTVWAAYQAALNRTMDTGEGKDAVLAVARQVVELDRRAKEAGVAPAWTTAELQELRQILWEAADR